MTKNRVFHFSLCAAALVATLAGCLPVSVKDRKNAVSTSGSGSGGAVSSVAAFQATVYPLVTAHCASCHTSTNMPFFATMDPQADHDALVTGGKVNLDNPAMSRLVQRLGQDSHNCWSTCASNSSDMQAAIAKWATLLKAAPTSSTSTATATGTTPAPRMNTIETVVPANIPGPGGATFATMTWPLTSAADTITPDVTGASFTLEIQKFDAFSYLVRNPRVISPSSAVYVSDVRISVNGVIRANDTTYSLLDQIAPMSATGTVISPASMVTLMDKGAGIDKIAISFAQVKANAAGGCKNLAGWQASVKTVFQAACVRCHNAGNSFDMVTGTDAQICVRTLGRVDVNFPSNSRLITYPLTGTGHAGGGNLINQTTANSWVNWINSER